ncbi:hypothetical protein Tco_1190082 [Tanacetum coccineum]
MILASGQPIPYRRPYWYHLNGPLHMLTVRKRVGLLLTHRLVALSDFHSDASSDSSSRYSLPDHSSPDLPSTSARLSRKRRRDSNYLADVEVDSRVTSEPSRSRGTDVGVDDDIERVDESHSEHEIDPMQATIEACETGPVEVRVERVTHPAMPEDIPEPAQEGAVEVTYETLGDLVQRFHDHTEAIPVHRIQVIEGVQREQGHRIVGVESAVTALTERIAELERDNRRLRGTASVESQRVDRLQRGMSRMQRELRQIRRFRFYDRVRVGRFEACARKHMGYHP